MAETQSTRTCSVDGCEKPFHARGWCSYHYNRAYATGDPTTPRKKRGAKVGAAVRDECLVQGCSTLVGPSGARGYCSTHYSRWRRSGDPGIAARMTMARDGVCSVEQCDRAIYSTGLCQMHKYRFTTAGSVKKECLYCGRDMSNRPRARKFCDASHLAMFHRHGGNRPTEKTCARCGSAFSLRTPSEKSGRTKRADAKMCPECKKARVTRHGWSVKALVAHHGVTDCGICGEPVDLTLKAPDMMRPSIDHIVPFAHGGSNEPENLQLAHLHCNHVKSDSGYARGRRSKNSV